MPEIDLFLDPWDVEYGAEFPLSGGAAPSCDVGLDVECPAAQWAPVAPEPRPSPSRLYFVDGVRRLEARVLARGGDGVCFGAFGTYAVGCADMLPKPRISEELVGRVIALGSGQRLGEAVTVSPVLVYAPQSSPSPDPDGPLQAIQNCMRAAEEVLARRLSEQAEALVVTDGPLTFSGPAGGATVGFIKRLHELYLPDPSILRTLPKGRRTPLFLLTASARFERFAWFVRLSEAGPADFDLAGLARLEVSATVGLERARHLADLTACLLPRLAPTRGRDPRAPQNLLPIGALESALRRRMGDARLVRRHIESHLARKRATV